MKKISLLALFAIASTLNLLGMSDDLYWATADNDEKQVKILLAQKANPNGDKTDNSTSVACIPLHVAATQNNPIIAQLLLDAGADIHQKSLSDQNALHIATQGNNATMVKFLLKNNANPNSFDAYKISPLYIALVMNKIFLELFLSSTKIEIIQDLLNYGALTTLVINNKTKRMHAVALKTNRPDIANLINQHEIKRDLNLKKPRVSQFYNTHFLFLKN